MADPQRSPVKAIRCEICPNIITEGDTFGQYNDETIKFLKLTVCSKCASELKMVEKSIGGIASSSPRFQTMFARAIAMKTAQAVDVILTNCEKFSEPEVKDEEPDEEDTEH